MRILSNFFGKLKTYGFDKRYNTKKFYQKIEIPRDNYTVKLVNLFGPNNEYDSLEDLDMTNKEQYLRINFGDDTVFKGLKLINSGKYNTNAETITHTYSKAGVYIVTIESIEDLILIENDKSYLELSKGRSSFSSKIELKTLGIGGVINSYIPFGNEVLNNELYESIKSLLMRPEIEDGGIDQLRLNNTNYSQDDKFLKSNWMCTVEKFNCMIAPLEFKYNVTIMNHQLGLKITNYGLMFSRWFKYSTSDLNEAIYEHMDKTFYNLFKERHECVNLFGFMSHTKDMIKVSDGLNLSYILKMYTSDFIDFDSNEEEKYPFKICNMDFIFWDTESNSSKYRLKTLNDDLRFIDKEFLYRNTDSKGMRFSFGLMPKNLSLEKSFRFSYLFPNTSISDDESNPYSIDFDNLRTEGLFLGSKIKIAPDLIQRNFSIKESNNGRFVLNYDNMFSYCINDSSEDIIKEDLNSEVELAYVHIGNINSLFMNRFSKITAIDMFKGFENLFENDVNKFYSFKSGANISNISIFNNKSKHIIPSELSVRESKVLINLYNSFSGNYDLNLFTNINNNKTYLQFFNKTNISDLNVNLNNIIFDLKLTGMLSGLKGDNRIITMDIQKCKFYFDFNFNQLIKRNITYTYSYLFKNANIFTPTRDRIDFLMPLYLKFRHRYNTLTYDQVKDKYIFQIDIDSIAFNSDYDTKELIMKSLSVPEDLDSTELYNFTEDTPDVSEEEMNPLPPMPPMFFSNFSGIHVPPPILDEDMVGSTTPFHFPMINRGTLAFANETSKIVDYPKLAFDKQRHLHVRDRSKYYTNKTIYRNNVYGLHIPELFFYDRNFGSYVGSSFSEMFSNNLSLSVDYYKEPLKLRLNLLNKDCYGMFKLDVDLDYDKVNNYKLSEFNFRNDLNEDIFIEYNSKHAYIFDHLRFIDPNIVDELMKLNFNSGSSIHGNTIIRRIANLMKNRIVHTHMFKLLSIYNETPESYQSIVDNKLSEETIVYPYINRKFNHYALRIFDTVMGIKDNLSNPDVNYFTKYNIDLTRNYKFSIHYNLDRNKLNVNKSCKVDMLPNICSVFNMEINQREITEWVQSNSSNKTIRFKIDVVDKSIIQTYQVPSSYREINSIDISNSISIKDDIIESRVYISNTNENNVDNFIPIINFEYENYKLCYAWLTNIVTNNFTIPSIINSEKNIYLLNHLNLFYISPSSMRYIVKYILDGNMNNKNIFIDGKSLQSILVPNSDMFDLLYVRNYMNNFDSNIKIGYSIDYPEKTKVLRDNDLKFLSYFENIENIDYIGDIRFISGEGLLHNDYVEENKRLVKIKSIKNFFSTRSQERSHLISISGSLCNNFIPNEDNINVTENTKTHYNINISNCFSNSGAFSDSDIFILKDFNESFFDGISYLNSNCNEVHPLFIANIMNSYYLPNSYYKTSLLESNIIASAILIGMGEKISSKYKRANTLDDYDVNNLEIEVFSFDTGDMASIRLESVMIEPMNILGNRFNRIIISIPKYLRKLITNTESFPSIEWKDFFMKMGEGPDVVKANSVDYFLFDPKIDFDFRTPTLLFENDAIYRPTSLFKIHKELTNYYTHAKQWELEYSTPYNEVRGSELTDENSDSIYLIKVLFNYHSTKRLTLIDIERMIFNNLQVYQYSLVGFKINVDCDIRMEIEVPARSNELVNKKELTLNKYQRDGYIELEDNTYLSQIEVENIISEDYSKMTRMMEIDFKVRINKHFIPMNNELFRNKVFVKDNADNFFEMQQLVIRKKENLVPSIENDPYWHINISNSNFTSDVTLNEATKARLYTGQIIFTTSFIKYDNIKDPLYLKNNTLTINVPMELNEVVVYAINDTPFSLYNSDGVVYEIYGECGFDLEPYFNKNPEDINLYTLYIDSYLYEISNGYKVHYISPSHFNGFGTTMNSKRKFYLEFNEFFIEKFDLEILSKFGERCVALINSFNSEEHKIDVYGYMRPRVSPFSISSSFNVNTNIIGFSTLHKPFNDITLSTVSYSFNLREYSLNRFIPEGFLNSNLSINNSLQGSLNKCIIGYKLRTMKLMYSENRHFLVDNSCFDGSLYQEIINKFGFYKTVLHVMNIDTSSNTNLITKPGYTKDYFISALNALKQYISNNTTNTVEELNLNNSKANRKILVK